VARSEALAEQEAVEAYHGPGASVGVELQLVVNVADPGVALGCARQYLCDYLASRVEKLEKRRSDPLDCRTRKR